MSRSLNKAQVIGYLGSDPEVRTTSGGTKVATLSVATSRTWTNQSGQEQEKTEWHRVVAWEGLAGVCEDYLTKGDRVYVEGLIQYRQWEGDDGRTRYTTEIRADNLIMLGSSGSRGGSGGRHGGGRRSSQGPAAKPTREEKQVDGARRSGPGDADEFTDDALMGDDDLPF